MLIMETILFCPSPDASGVVESLLGENVFFHGLKKRL
jgi:hypothetical protein